VGSVLETSDNQPKIEKMRIWHRILTADARRMKEKAQNRKKGLQLLDDNLELSQLRTNPAKHDWLKPDVIGL